MATSAKLDPVTLEVLRNALPAVANEMAADLQRTSYNMMIYEVRDYCTALLNVKGELIAQNVGGVSHFVADLGVLVTQTLAGLERSTNGPVLASSLKRTILRKDPTFNEANYGFRGFRELLRHLADNGVLELREGSAQGDPEVHFPAHARDQDAAFELLRSTVERLTNKSGPPHLSGLKTEMRKVQPDFSEKRYGFNTFLSFVKAARTRDLLAMHWDEGIGDYRLHVT